MKKRKVTKKIIFIFVVLVILAAAYSLVEPYLIEIKETHMESNRIPPSFDGFKMVFISDLHHGPAYSIDRIRDDVDRVIALKPDIVLLGGDYTIENFKYIEPCIKELSRIKPPFGTFAIMGNHDFDYWDKGMLTKKYMKQYGIKDIDNAAVWINKGTDKIRLGGVSDLLMDKQDINPTIGPVGDNDFTILLSHNPDYAEELQTDKVNLVLSGHTHGGIVSFFGLWAPFVPSKYGQKYRTGEVDAPHTKVVVTNGLGNYMYFPVRFFARPQINVIYLQRK